MGHKTYGEMLGTYEVTMAGISNPAFNAVYTQSESPSRESRSWYNPGVPGNAHFTVALQGHSRTDKLVHFHISVDVGGVNGKVYYHYDASRGNLRAHVDLQGVRDEKQAEFDEFFSKHAKSLDEMALKFFGIASGIFLTKVYDKDSGKTFTYDLTAV